MPRLRDGLITVASFEIGSFCLSSDIIHLLLGLDIYARRRRVSSEGGAGEGEGEGGERRCQVRKPADELQRAIGAAATAAAKRSDGEVTIADQTLFVLVFLCFVLARHYVRSAFPFDTLSRI